MAEVSPLLYSCRAFCTQHWPVSSFQGKSLRSSSHLDRTLKYLCYSGRLNEAIETLFITGLQVSSSIYALLLQDCIFRKEFMMGKHIHARMVMHGFVPDEYLKTKLLILYAKSANLKAAHLIFNQLACKSVIPWNALISGYVQNGMIETGLDVYFEMKRSGFVPDQFTFSTIFRAYASLAVLQQGRRAHGVMIKCPIRENVVVNSALMDMYFKCSSPGDGHRVFSTSLGRNVITWTALISGYGQLGRHEEVLKLFDRMVTDGFTPNLVTFLAVLCACSHRGLVREGWRYFSSMIDDYGIMPGKTHYAAMVDLLGRAGRLEEAYELIKEAPCNHHSVIWGTLLGASRMHKAVDIAKVAAIKYIVLEPECPDKYVLLSNTCATFGLWGEVAKVRGAMKLLGMKKEPAYSRIEVKGEVHFFFMGDKSHCDYAIVCEIVKEIDHILKDISYLPDP